MPGLGISDYISLSIAAFSIIGSAISVGFVFGSLRGRVKEAFSTININEKFNISNITNIKEDLLHLDERIDKLEERNRSIERLLENRYSDVKKHVDSNLKDLSSSLQEIRNICYCRKSNVDKIPNIDERIRQLEIDVGVLPSKLSEELAKAFSEEYKNIVSTLSIKNKK